MKKFLSLLVLISSSAYAQHVGTGQVTNVVPIVEQVPITRQHCIIENVRPSEQNAGGAILGAIVGGVVGNHLGHGGGRDFATGVGIIAGAMAGNEMQNGTRNYQRCTPITEYQSIARGYTVTYVFNGQSYTQQMSYHPGNYVNVVISAR